MFYCIYALARILPNTELLHDIMQLFSLAWLFLVSKAFGDNFPKWIRLTVLTQAFKFISPLLLIWRNSKKTKTKQKNPLKYASRIHKVQIVICLRTDREKVITLRLWMPTNWRRKIHISISFIRYFSKTIRSYCAN